MTDNFAIVGWAFAVFCTLRNFYMTYWLAYWRQRAQLLGAKEKNESLWATLKELRNDD